MKSINRTTLLFVLFFLTIMGCKENFKIANFKNGEKIKISGILVLAGSEPLIKMGIDTGNDFYYLPHNSLKKYRNLLGKKIILSGKYDLKELFTADYKNKIIEKHITEIYSIKLID